MLSQLFFMRSEFKNKEKGPGDTLTAQVLLTVQKRGVKGESAGPITTSLLPHACPCMHHLLPPGRRPAQPRQADSTMLC